MEEAQIEVREVSLSQECNVAEEGSSLRDGDNDAFECNICFDSVQEPVVTLCGHLYCWPCIYRWLHVQESDEESNQQPQCPICKTNISASELVPLYGRHASRFESRNTDHYGLNIPSRPASGLHSVPHFTHQSPASYHRLNLSNSQIHSPAPRSISQHEVDALSVILNPMICKFGEMVYARIFGISDTDALSFPYTASYPYIASSNPRIRRQERKVEESLNRLSIFFFCCMLLCLFFF